MLSHRRSIVGVIWTVLSLGYIVHAEHFSCSSNKLDSLCGEYCYKMFKPVLLDTSEFRKEIEDYKEKYHDVDEKMANMEQNAIRQENVINYQTDQMAKLIIKNEKYKETIKGKDDQIKMLIVEIYENSIKSKAQEFKIVEIEKENKLKHDEKDTQINKLESKITVMDNKNKLESNKKVAQIELLKSQIEKQSEEVKNKNTEITSLKSDLQSRDAQISEYKQNLEKAESCLPFGNSSHLHAFQIPGLKPFVAPCDSQIAGPGWMVIQRRIDGRVDFYRKWDDYKEGFGNVSAEFWLGLEKLHRLTTSRRYELLVHVVTAKNIVYNIKYDKFEIGSELEQYKLKSLGIKTGIGMDNLRLDEGWGFSTFDRDNDDNNTKHYAKNFHTAWWFKNNPKSDLHGPFSAAEGMWWGELLKSCQMLIRPWKPE